MSGAGSPLARRAEDVGWHAGAVPGDLAGASEQAARRVLGPLGLVRSCDVVPRQPGTPRLHIRMGRGPRRMPGWPRMPTLDGTGVSTGEDEARLAAIAETVERYAGMAPVSDDRLVSAPYSDLGDTAVDPGRFALLSDAQYGRFPQLQALSDTKVVDWCWAYSLTAGRAALVPAGVVYTSRARRPPNDFIPELTTTGTACHVSMPHAVLAGLCEVLERDALTIAWRNRLPHPSLDASGTSIEALLAGPLAAGAARFDLFSVPSDSPFSVVLAVAQGSGGWPHAAVGAACRPHPVAAARRALLEASQILSRLVDRHPRRPPRVRTFDDRAALYAGAREASLLRRVLGHGPRLPLAGLGAADAGTVGDQLALAGAALAERGLEVLVVELTTPDVAATGYRVVRVVVPGAVDMNPDARCPFLGGQRLYDVPVRLGLHPRAVAENEVNRLPVPLA